MRFLYFLLIIPILFIGCKSTILNADSPRQSININYSLASDAYVKLTLENSYNTIVAILVDAQQAAGVHQVSFDSYKFPEGVYFYTLIARGVGDNSYFEATRKIILIKKWKDT